MPSQKMNKADHDKLSRMVCLLLNRAMMYKADHPHIKDTITNFHQELAKQLSNFPSLALILNRDQLFIDEELVDPRINVSRIIGLFKKTGVQSISFVAGITAEDLQTLINFFTSPHKFPDCDRMIEELNFRGVQNLKINHVFYKKVTKDDEIISHRNKGERSSVMRSEEDAGLSRQFMKMLVEGVLTEEAEKTLSMKTLLDDPAGLSESMLAAESRSMEAVAAGALPSGSWEEGALPDEDLKKITPGATLLYQIQTLSDDVKQKIEAGDQVDMMDVADAVFEMKRQLTIGIEAQKALNQAYANEEKIREQMEELTDNVIIKLIKDEYQQGKITTARLAQILRRLVPEVGGLKRLLPKIKAALLAEGMPMSEYLQLVRQLGKELESEGLSQILREAAESVGVDGEELIDEIRKKPEKAAELLAIAAEIRKGDGDEAAFTETLINYVEQLGAKIEKEAAEEGDPEKEAQARQMMTDVGSGLMAQLKGMNLSAQALAGMEERINARIEAVFEKLAVDRSFLIPGAGEPTRKERTLLQMMEHSPGDNEELRNVLRVIRSEVDAGKIDENNFGQIYARLIEQEKTLREEKRKRQMPPGVLKPEEFRFYLEKEMFRAKRHNHPLSTLSFTFVNVSPQTQVPADKKIRKTDLFDAAYSRLIGITRASDIIGELNNDTMIIILPMADRTSADTALRRISKLIHDNPIDVEGILLKVIIAGAASSFLPDMKPNIESFIRTINYELEHVAMRVKNIHHLT